MWHKEQLKRNLMKRLITFVVFLVILIPPEIVVAQCAMCRAVLESEGNVEVAEGINNGIVYLMAIPYILVAILFYFVFRKVKN